MNNKKALEANAVFDPEEPWIEEPLDLDETLCAPCGGSGWLLLDDGEEECPHCLGTGSYVTLP